MGSVQLYLSSHVVLYSNFTETQMKLYTTGKQARGPSAKKKLLETTTFGETKLKVKQNQKGTCLLVGDAG